MPNKIKEIQHYVPQFLLRNFQKGKGIICVFDKHSNKTFETNIKNIAAERNFNEFTFQGETLTLEPSLCELEGKVSNIINTIKNKKTLNGLASEEKSHLAHFIAVQLLRTNGQKVKIKDLRENLSRGLIEMGVDPNVVAADEENDQLLFIKGLTKAHQFLPHLVDKVWVLLETTGKHSYYISDNPVTLQNQNKRPGRGNLGFAVEGIEIYLPITKTLTLALWCSSHARMVTEMYEKAKDVIHGSKKYNRLVKNIDEQLKKNEEKVARKALKEAGKVLKAIKTGNPLKSLPENVEYLNSLQVLFSERFVMGSINDFQLAQKMVNENLEARVGRRISMA